MPFPQKSDFTKKKKKFATAYLLSKDQRIAYRYQESVLKLGKSLWKEEETLTGRGAAAPKFAKPPERNYSSVSAKLRQSDSQSDRQSVIQ